MEKYLEQALQSKITSNKCKLCCVNLSSPSVTKQHCASKHHKNNVAMYLESVKQESISSCENYDLQGIPQFKDSDKDEKHGTENGPKRAERFYCYPCKRYVGSKAEKDKHIQIFPHVLLVKLKSVLLKEEIVDEYWSIHGTEVICLLCNLMMSDLLDSTSHINTSKHKDNYNNWFKNLPTCKVAIDVRWYYCKMCDKDLDGTSESEGHYSSPSHSKRRQLYCYICKVSNATIKLWETHKSSSLHMGMLQKSQKPTAILGQGAGHTERSAPVIKSVDSGTIKAESNPEALNTDSFSTPKQYKENTNNITTDLNPLVKSNETVSSQQILENALYSSTVHYSPDANISNNSSIEEGNTTSSTPIEENSVTPLDSKSLGNSISSSNVKNTKEQVFNELELLAQKLYYSKAVPYEVALDYLKLTNREVDELLRKYSNVNTSDVPRQHNFKLGETTYTNNHVRRKEPGLVPEEFSDCTDSVDTDCTVNYTKKDDLQAPQLKLLDTTTSKIVHNLDQPNEDNFISEAEDFSQNHSFSSDNDSLLTGSNSKTEFLERRDSDSVTTTDTEHDDEDKAQNISDLIINVMERKREIEQDYSNEHSIEKEVLNEMGIFLRQLEDGGIPLEEILTYLESVNNELETKEFDNELEAKEFDNRLETKEFDNELETKDFDNELETKEFDNELETKDFDNELETKEFDNELETKEFDNELETKEFDIKLETKELENVLETKEFDNELETKEFDNELQTKELDNALETKEFDNKLETKELENVLETKEFDKELETKEFDNELETKELDNALETKEFDNKLEMNELENVLETKEFDNELETKEFDNELETRELNNELETKEFDNELETKEFDNELDTKEFDNKLETKELENELETKEFDNEVESKEIDNELETKEIDNELETNEIDNELETEEFDNGLETMEFDGYEEIPTEVDEKAKKSGFRRLKAAYRPVTQAFRTFSTFCQRINFLSLL